MLSHARHKPNAPGLFLALLALLLWLPIPLASNHAWSWTLMEVWVYLMSAIWLLKYAHGTVQVTVACRKARPVLILFSLWLVYGLFQMIPLPHGVVKLLSPNAAEMYEKANLSATLAEAPIAANASSPQAFGPYLNQIAAQTRWQKEAVEATHPSPSELGSTAALSPAIGQSPQSSVLSPILSRVTLDLNASALSWFKSLAYVLLFALTLLLVDSRKRLRTLAYTLVFSGLVQAVYGAMSVAFGGGGVATGTFVNRNHYAGYLVLCISVGIGLLIAWSGTQPEQIPWRKRIRQLGHLVLSARAPLRIFLAIMVIALVLTHSRMGNVAFFAALLTSGTLALALFRKSPRPTVILIASLIAIDILIIGSYVGIDRIRERIEQTTLATEHRDEVDINAWTGLRHYPLVGAGMGSFYGVFPRYAEPDLADLAYDHAHNDYLEVLTETGIVGLALLGSAVAFSWAMAIGAQRKRRDGLMRGLAFAVAMAVTAMLIHASVEFNLQIPAYAATFVALLAMAWVTRHLMRAPHDVAIRH